MVSRGAWTLKIQVRFLTFRPEFKGKAPAPHSGGEDCGLATTEFRQPDVV
jgi:hypothetical protein